MHRPEEEKGAATLGAPAYSGAGTAGIWTKGNPATATVATDLDEEIFNDLWENLFEILSRGGVTATKGRKEDLADAIQALIGSNLKGLLLANFKYVSATVVRLERGLEGKLWIEIDDLLRFPAADLDFDITTDLETGQTEAASTPYYCYVEDNGGTLVAHISATAPVLDPTLKVGYHPGTGNGSTTWRCVGAFFNDDSSNIVPFVTDGTWIRWKKGGTNSPDRVHALGTTIPTAWTSLLLPEVPDGATAVQLEAHCTCDDTIYAFGDSGAAVALPASVPLKPDPFNATGFDDVLATLGGEVSGVDANWFRNFIIPIADPTAPAIKWGLVDQTGGVNGISDPTLLAVAFSFPFLPRR